MSIERPGLLVKEKIIEEIRERFNRYNNVIFVSFGKVKAFSLNILRNDIREKGGNFFVVKNTLIERFFSLSQKEVKDFLNGQTGLVFSLDNNIVDVCKVLFNFAKENENFKINGGILTNKKVSSTELENISKLPSKEIILGSVLSTIVSPLTSFLAFLRQPLLDFVLILEDLKKRKEGNQ